MQRLDFHTLGILITASKDLILFILGSHPVTGLHTAVLLATEPTQTAIEPIETIRASLLHRASDRLSFGCLYRFALCL